MIFALISLPVKFTTHTCSRWIVRVSRAEQASLPRLHSVLRVVCYFADSSSYHAPCPPGISSPRGQTSQAAGHMVPGDYRPVSGRDLFYADSDYPCTHYYRIASGELLKGKKNGTFLCRSTKKQTRLKDGELHTHTVDIV